MAAWTLLVPVKGLTAAKSRLHPDPAVRRALAEAFLQDTLTVAQRAAGVAAVHAVCGDDEGAVVAAATGVRVLRSDLALNPALADAARPVPGPVGVLPADLPALTPEVLAEALLVADAGACVVGDRHGRGTVLLTAARGVDLRPRFGADSLTAHIREGSRDLAEQPWTGLRTDVDTWDDLAVAEDIGTGEVTSQVLGQLAR